MYHPATSIQPNLSGHSLLLPALSIGNVGQFAIDILIHNLECSKIGYFSHPSLLSLVGYDESNALVTAAELYLLPEFKIIILQLRVPLIKGTANSFIKDLIKWVEKQDLKDILCIGSVNANCRIDAQLTGPQFRYMLTPQAGELYFSTLDALGWRQMEEQLSLEGDFKYNLLGCGHMRRLFKTCMSSYPVTLVFTFSHEGDNVPDALLLVSTLNRWLKLLTGEWKFPPSWQLLHGPPPNTAIY